MHTLHLNITQKIKSCFAFVEHKKKMIEEDFGHLFYLSDETKDKQTPPFPTSLEAVADVFYQNI